MTISTLMQKTNDKEKTAAVKKAFANINNAIKLAEVEHGSVKSWNDEYVNYNGEFGLNGRHTIYVKYIMENLKYVDMAKNLLGDELYLKMLTELSKDFESNDMIEYGKEVIDKCCLLILTIGMSKVNLENVDICLKGVSVKVSCKEFAKKYEIFTEEIKSNIIGKLS